MEMFCTTIAAGGEFTGHPKYEEWTEYVAKWVLDKAELSLLKQEASSPWQLMQDSGLLQC